MTNVLLRNDEIELSIDVDNGAAFTGLSRVGGSNVLACRTWETPAPPSSSRSYGDDTSDFLAAYPGGWHVLFPNAGDACDVLGVHLPFHGDTARARWRVVSVDRASVLLRCPTRLPVILERRVVLRDSAVVVEETARSDAPFDVPVIWGHHPIFSARPGMRIDLPGGSVDVPADRPATPVTDLHPGTSGDWPRGVGYDGFVDLSTVPDGPVERFANISAIPAPWAALRDPASGDGVALSWDAGTFGNLWIWLQVGGAEFPWFGRASYIGIEPQSAPNSRGLASAMADGHALSVPAGGSLSSWMTVALFTADERQVVDVSRHGEVSRREPML
ncbi:MAG TPA: hypothetical protein VGL75_12985 [Acidothermaceae bacterium]|jgi:hypothetical protein